MESHTKKFLRIFLSSSATFLQYLQSSSSSSFSGHTPPFLPSHFFIQGSYSGSLVFSALDEKEQESEFVAVNPARRSHRYSWPCFRPTLRLSITSARSSLSPYIFARSSYFETRSTFIPPLSHRRKSIIDCAEGDIAPWARRPHGDMWMLLWNCLPKQNARAREMSKREEESSQHACRNFCKWWEYRLD